MDERTLRRFIPKTRTGEQGCIVWTGARTDQGYGQLWDDRKPKYAHRLAYEHWIGPIPEGLQLDHLCRNRACVNPEHLEPVSNKENGVRGQAGYHSFHTSKTHCPSGHAYDEENTYRYRGERHCRACRQEASRRFRHARSGAGRPGKGWT